MSVLANINYLEWESDFFSLNTGRLEFSAQAPVLTQDRLEQFTVVHAKVASYDLLRAFCLLPILRCVRE